MWMQRLLQSRFLGSSTAVGAEEEAVTHSLPCQIVRPRHVKHTATCWQHLRSKLAHPQEEILSERSAAGRVHQFRVTGRVERSARLEPSPAAIAFHAPLRGATGTSAHRCADAMRISSDNSATRYDRCCGCGLTRCVAASDTRLRLRSALVARCSPLLRSGDAWLR